MNHYFIDLFAGCGGLSLGLEQAGFKPVYVNELNKDALETYLINREEYPYLKNKEFHSNDIFDLTKDVKLLKELESNLKQKFQIKKGELSLVVGGPPCQGYSGIGHRRSYSVDKKDLPSNFLYREMCKVIKHFEPKIFVFENVRGLISARWTKNGKKGEIFEDVKKEFNNLKNYQVSDFLVHAKDYGVPQNRPRILIIGIRKDIKFDGEGKFSNGYLPKPTHDYPHPEELLSDLIDEKYEEWLVTKEYLTQPKNDTQAKLRTKKGKNSFYSKGEKLTEQEYSNHTDTVKSKFSKMIESNGKIPPEMQTKKFAQRLITKKWGSGGPNITATSLPDDYVHFSQPRSFTVREWARFQTFPDWYVFKGKRTTGGIRRAGNPREGIFDRELPKYTQIGNAVPVKLAFEIGKHLLRIIDP